MPKEKSKRLFPACWECQEPFDIPEGERQYVNCPWCRARLARERQQARLAAVGAHIVAEVEAMDWPEKLNA